MSGSPSWSVSVNESSSMTAGREFVPVSFPTAPAGHLRQVLIATGVVRFAAVPVGVRQRVAGRRQERPLGHLVGAPSQNDPSVL